MEEMKKLTLDEVRCRNLRVYYKAFLMDEMSFRAVDVVGRFENLKDAELECRRWRKEEIYKESEFLIIKFVKDGDGYIKKVMIRY